MLNVKVNKLKCNNYIYTIIIYSIMYSILLSHKNNVYVV